MARTVPARLVRAVELLDLDAEADVLELGCGPGVALALVSHRLAGGRVTGIDRSATAVERARTRLRAAGLERETAVHEATVADAAKVLDGRCFDVVFAVNLNVFWTAPEGQEAEVVLDLLAPDGRLHLFYAAPSPTRSAEACDRVVAGLTAKGFSATSGSDEVLGWVRATP